MSCMEDVFSAFENKERRCGTDTGGESLLKRAECQRWRSSACQKEGRPPKYEKGDGESGFVAISSQPL